MYLVLYISKAFDQVPHHRLLKKTQHYGIRGNTHKWIESFLFNSQQEVTKRKSLKTVSVINSVSRVIPSISDHEVIYIEASLRPHKTPTQSRTVVLYKKADFEAIREGLCTFYSEMPEPNTVTTDELWSSFKGRSQSLITKHVPSKVYKGLKNQIRKLKWQKRKHLSYTPA